MTFRFCDESDYGFGWIPHERLMRTSHALTVEGRVWLVDAVLWPDALERARSLGEPAGVIQLLDRHDRDCADVAAQLGAPHLRVPDRLDAPLEIFRVVNMALWHERALWWPERRVLVVADALGTVGYFTPLWRCARRASVPPSLPAEAAARTPRARRRARRPRRGRAQRLAAVPQGAPPDVGGNRRARVVPSLPTKAAKPRTTGRGEGDEPHTHRGKKRERRLRARTERPAQKA